MSILFSHHCCHLYGIETCIISENTINRLATTWNKSVRKIWNLPYTAHRNILPDLIQNKTIQDTIQKRAETLIDNMSKLNNSKTCDLIQLVKHDKCSICHINSSCSLQAPDIDMHRGMVIRELTLCTYGEKIVEGFTTEHINLLIEWFSTT